MSNKFDGVKVFSATKGREREDLGTVITEWLRANSGKLEVVDKTITQSSDNEFHCLTIVMFYKYQPAKVDKEFDEVWAGTNPANPKKK